MRFGPSLQTDILDLFEEAQSFIRNRAFQLASFRPILLPLLPEDELSLERMVTEENYRPKTREEEAQARLQARIKRLAERGPKYGMTRLRLRFLELAATEPRVSRIARKMMLPSKQVYNAAYFLERKGFIRLEKRLWKTRLCWYATRLDLNYG
jgi:hypothetical protein